MNQFRTSAMKCFYALAHKGMDDHLKVELIVNIKFFDVIESYQMKYVERNEDAPYDE
jgi:hypothetical protein